MRVSRGEHEFSTEDVTSAGRHETILHIPFVCFQSKFITVHQGAHSIDDFTAQKKCSALIKPGKYVLYLFFKQKKLEIHQYWKMHRSYKVTQPSSQNKPSKKNKKGIPTICTKCLQPLLVHSCESGVGILDLEFFFLEQIHFHQGGL